MIYHGKTYKIWLLVMCKNAPNRDGKPMKRDFSVVFRLYLMLLRQCNDQNILVLLLDNLSFRSVLVIFNCNLSLFPLLQLN